MPNLGSDGAAPLESSDCTLPSSVQYEQRCLMRFFSPGERGIVARLRQEHLVQLFCNFMQNTRRLLPYLVPNFGNEADCVAIRPSSVPTVKLHADVVRAFALLTRLCLSRTKVRRRILRPNILAHTLDPVA